MVVWLPILTHGRVHTLKHGVDDLSNGCPCRVVNTWVSGGVEDEAEDQSLGREGREGGIVVRRWVDGRKD